jgi:agmatinase
MKRVHDMGLNIVQAGIRAQCIEEAELIKKSKNIHTFYAHYIRKNEKTWIDQALAAMGDDVYITIDADGFDPSIMPAVGTAEPNGLFWNETLELLRRTVMEKNVVGFDIVECAPMKGTILSEYTLAKLAYRLMGYIVTKPAAKAKTTTKVAAKPAAKPVAKTKAAAKAAPKARVAAKATATKTTTRKK